MHVITLFHFKKKKKTWGFSNSYDLHTICGHGHVRMFTDTKPSLKTLRHAATSDTSLVQATAILSHVGKQEEANFGFGAIIRFWNWLVLIGKISRHTALSCHLVCVGGRSGRRHLRNAHDAAAKELWGSEVKRRCSGPDWRALAYLSFLTLRHRDGDSWGECRIAAFDLHVGYGVRNCRVVVFSCYYMRE